MADERDFTGIWHSTYWYPSNQRPGEQDTSEYTVNVHQDGNKLVMESLPDNIKAHMTINLTLDSILATGHWYENTSPHGEFEGMIYSGAMQLIISEDGAEMDGQWVGIGREKQDDGSYKPRIYNGKWLLKRANEQEAAAANRALQINAES
jgi:hypothetical protein